MVAPQRADPPSARAQDLGRRLRAEVEKFEAQYPGTSRKDLRDAAAFAIGEESVTVPPRRRVAAALVAGLVALGVAATVISSGGAESGDTVGWPVVAVVLAATVAGVLAAVLRIARR